LRSFSSIPMLMGIAVTSVPVLLVIYSSFSIPYG
jgi:hypothetical protein